ncbi:collectin-10 isoform X3 [Narcine bancroftii]|uniref:collectin-10 isoform X3 n=1 Tax=Narcine bancroftii TaxID=1343680 RepID=UPI0038319DD9
MERLTRPEKLDIDPQSATAFKAFNFWLLNFENFLRLIEVEEDNQRLTALLSMVSLRVYENIQDETTYTAAIKVLKELYNQPVNRVHARLVLASRKQQPNESSRAYLQVLKALGKDCNCVDKTAAEITNDLVRDAYVARLRSNEVRLRLLEQGVEKLEDVARIAITMEDAALKSTELSRDWTPRSDIENHLKMEVDWVKKFLFVLVFLQLSIHCITSDICSTHIILPGPKGEQGEKGDIGEPGKTGKLGPLGLIGRKDPAYPFLQLKPTSPGLAGEPGQKGENGQRGKIGPIGAKGRFCDCGRYRKIVGQMDINIARLNNTMRFVKNVIAGIKETEEKFYLIVKEGKNYNAALVHCKTRGGSLAMPKDEETNSLIAAYVNKTGLSRVFIGVNDLEKEKQFMYTDSTPLQNYSHWRPGEPNNAFGGEDCVEMVSDGGWNDVECHLTIYFVCEFLKKIS